MQAQNTRTSYAIASYNSKCKVMAQLFISLLLSFCVIFGLATSKDEYATCDDIDDNSKCCNNQEASYVIVRHNY